MLLLLKFAYGMNYYYFAVLMIPNALNATRGHMRYIIDVDVVVLLFLLGVCFIGRHISRRRTTPDDSQCRRSMVHAANTRYCLGHAVEGRSRYA